MNLLTVAPLIDSRGNIRYFIGAQVDVTGLCKDCTGLDSLKKLLDEKQGISSQEQASPDEAEPESTDEFQELTEMFNDEEMEVVRKCGGRMNQLGNDEIAGYPSHRPRLHVRDPSNGSKDGRETPLYSTVGKWKVASLFQHVSNIPLFTKCFAKFFFHCAHRITVSSCPTISFFAYSIRFSNS
jgi:hypothetical protein